MPRVLRKVSDATYPRLDSSPATKYSPAIPESVELSRESFAMALHLYDHPRSNARLQPQAARNARIEHDARIEGAPTVGCEPWLDSTI